MRSKLSFLALLAVGSSSVACAPVRPSAPPIERPRDPRPSPCASSDAGAATTHDASDRAGLLGDAGSGEDARMSSEPFLIEPSEVRVIVHAAERTFVPVRLTRAPGHRAYVELKASGLPPGVSAIAAIGPDPSDVGFVIEAADTARPIVEMPFTIEAHAEGVRASRRMLLTIEPERPIPED